MTEKEYYNQIVLDKYYHKLFDEEIENEVIKPLTASIINTFTEFHAGSFGGHTFTDPDGRKVRVTINVEKVNWEHLEDLK